jgi:hypothetical protein
MNEAVPQIRDIHGFDGVPWWPPGPGWWALAAGLILLIWLAWNFRSTLRLRIPIPVITLGDWRWDAARKLRALRRQVQRDELGLKAAAGSVSELLRRVAMARLGRAACAGLTGKDWLGWLRENDPNRFDWESHGRLLLDAPYAPPTDTAAGTRRQDLLELIDAAHDWVAKEQPKKMKPLKTEAAHV